MLNAWVRRTGIVLALAAVGFGLYRCNENATANEARESKQWEAKLAAETRAAREKAAAPIQPRELAVGAHQLVVVDVPSVGGYDRDRVEYRRCYVWRDVEFKASDLWCDGEAPRHLSDLDYGER